MEPINPAGALQLDPATGRFRLREFTLDVLSGEAIQVTLTGPVILGSGSDAGVRVADSALSRHHLELLPFGDGVRVRDLASMNGTFLGETRVEQFSVYDTQTFTAGRTTLRVQSQTSEILPEPYLQNSFGAALGDSDSMRQLFAVLDLVASTQSALLLAGETGTGKEVLARAVHDRSRQFGHAFVVVSCESSGEAMYSRLFGSSGAFFEAEGGTLYLENVEALPPEVQLTLVRTLETARLKRRGENEPRLVNVRVIASNRRDLSQAVASDRLREDLALRLSSVELHVPPLRERTEELPDLIRALLAAHGRSDFEIPDALTRRLSEHAWPGNLRELEDTVERALLVAGMDLHRTFGATQDGLVDALAKEYFVDLTRRFGTGAAALQKNAGLSPETVSRLRRKWAV
ncbi:MAG: sigma-54-dependent Fis family transcriptional regulator [Myxococcaceae bacterium]